MLNKNIEQLKIPGTKKKIDVNLVPNLIKLNTDHKQRDKVNNSNYQDILENQFDASPNVNS